MNQTDYFNQISKEIATRREGKNGVLRPVIVVFETTSKLKEYYNHISFDQFKRDSNCLTENIDKEIKKQIIERATKRGQVTLIESSFGRGTDFILRDEDVIKIGGVHILQVFFSKSASEEIQIKGRAARQGDPGSYSLVLLNKDLEYFGLSLEKISAQSLKTTWAEIKFNRDDLSRKEFESNQNFVEMAKKKHYLSKQFLDDIKNSNTNAENIVNFLNQENRGVANKTFKTLILMDGTFSMGPLLTTTLNVVYEMSQRAGQILEDNGHSSGCFFLQFAIYRNYNSNEDKILEKSDWENSPEKLRSFLQKQKASGGWGNEAIEIGLNYANQIEDLNQVILIGDSRANEKHEVISNRNDQKDGKGEKYWAGTKYSKPTYYEDELIILKGRNIKIHTFYVQSEDREKLEKAKKNFNEIAKATGGNSEFLDLSDTKNGADKLTNLITIEILRIIDEGLASVYQNKYGHLG